MTHSHDLLHSAYARAKAYQVSIPERRVFPAQEAIDNLAQFDELLPDTPQSPEANPAIAR